MGPENKEEKSLVPQAQAAIVMPAVSADKALAAWKEYEDLKNKICTPNDKQDIGGKIYLKKSYWRKIATFFNLSLECVKETRQELGIGFTYLISYKAIAGNGRFSYGDGSCSSDEKGITKTEHTTRATAHTRAYNRAVSNLVGGGEVSAEEIIASEAVIVKDDKAPAKTQSQNAKPNAATPKQIAAIESMAKKHNVNLPDYLTDKVNVDSVNDLTRATASTVISVLSAEVYGT